jgi:hypothetical protein
MIIVGDFKTPFTPTVILPRLKNQQTKVLIKQLYGSNRPNIYNRIFYPTDTEYTFFSTAYGTFSRIGHILGHKVNLNLHKKIVTTLYFIIPQWNKSRNQLFNRRNHRKYTCE